MENNGTSPVPPDGNCAPDEDKANYNRLLLLNRRGIHFPCGSGNIFVGEDVDLNRIEAKVELYPGCRLTGRKTLIQEGARIGLKGPCILHNMVIGKGAVLGSGSFEESVLLNYVKLGTSIRVRETCLMEEKAECSFSTDVKQTVLLANTVLGSEINFCDIFMAGGTSRADHSEVGSGVIHFNFTPFGESGDKVTASLLGDSPRGVFYRSPRIFIGGHSSLIGPVKIGFGSVVAAGSQVISNIAERTLNFGGRPSSKDIKDFNFQCYRSIARKVSVSIEYIGQLAALWHWYNIARRSAASTPIEEETVSAAVALIADAIKTRVNRFDRFHSYMKRSIALNRAEGSEGLVKQQETFQDLWPSYREKLLDYSKVLGDEKSMQTVIDGIARQKGAYPRNFPELITDGLDDKEVEKGSVWLSSILFDLTKDKETLAPPLKKG